MDAILRLAAADEIRNLRALYCRSVDLKDRDAFRSLFARDAVADYSGSTTDPNKGRAVDPKTLGGGVVEPLRGADQITATVMEVIAPLVTVHHCATGEIHVDTPDSARGRWPMVDRIRFPAGSDPKELVGYGFYDETYVREDGAWKIKTLAISRTRIDTMPA